MIKKKTSPETSLVVTGKCEVTKSAKAKALGANHTKSLGKRGKGMGTSKKKGRGRKRALPSDDEEDSSDGSSEGEENEEVKIEYM